MNGAFDVPDPEDRALIHLIASSDPGIKGIILDLLRASDGSFQNAPTAIRQVLEDLLSGMRLGGATDSEIEQRFGLGQGAGAAFDRALFGRAARSNGSFSRHWTAADGTDNDARRVRRTGRE